MSSPLSGGFSLPALDYSNTQEHLPAWSRCVSHEELYTGQTDLVRPSEIETYRTDGHPLSVCLLYVVVKKRTVGSGAGYKNANQVMLEILIPFFIMLYLLDQYHKAGGK